MPNQITRQYGGHVSAAGGVEKAIERGAAIGGNALQLFSGSPRVWARPKLEQFDAQKIASKKKEKSILSIFTHALYLVNLASDNPENIRKSMTALSFDLSFDAHIGGAGVVVHVGTHKGNGWTTVRDQVAKQIGELLTQMPSGATFLIENAASQKGKIGGDLEEVAWLIRELRAPQLGWCLDTCHAHAAGYGLGSVPLSGARRQLTLHQEVTRLNLWDSLRCIHVNDSKDPFDSGRDRHQNLGDGEIPHSDLEWFLRTPETHPKPLILEVPGITGEGPDAENISRLKALADISP